MSEGSFQALQTVHRRGCTRGRHWAPCPLPMLIARRPSSGLPSLLLPQDCNLALYNANYLPAAGGQPVPGNAAYATGTGGQGAPLCTAQVSSAAGGALTVVDANSTVLFRAPASPVAPAPIDTIPSGGSLGQSLNLYSLNALYYLLAQVCTRATVLVLSPLSMHYHGRDCAACMPASMHVHVHPAHAEYAYCCSAPCACFVVALVVGDEGTHMLTAHATRQGDGNLVFYSLASGSRKVAWASATYGISTHTPFRLQMQTVRGVWATSTL